MKPIPLIVIGSKQKNAYVGSVDKWSPCINAACGLGGQTPMIVEIVYESESLPPLQI